MTDRHSGYIVILKDDIREDDAEAVINALRMTKGVLSVEPIINTYEQMIATARARDVWRNKLLQLLEDDRKER